MGQAQIPVLNGATPAAPPGYQNARWQQGSSLGPDPTYGVPQIPDSCYVPNAGIAVVKTANYTLSIADLGKLIIANSASPITFTLPNPVPLNALSSPTTETRWTVRVANIGTGTLTLAHNSLQIDGAAADLNFAQFTGCAVFTDGTNYFTERGFAPPVSLPNFADAETVSGSGTNWTLAHSPSPAASLILVQRIPNFGGIVLIAGTDYTISGTTITTTNSLSSGVLRAWYRY